MTTFKAKIVKCSQSNYWYYDKIGEIVELERPVINGDQSEYWLQLKGSNRCVNINDFEEIKEGPEVFPFEVKIIKCSRSTWWYADKIGKVYQAISESKDNDQDYMIKDHQPIQKSDCVRLSSSAPKVLEAVGKPEYIYFGERAPFDLEKALAGEPLVQRDGVEIIELRYFRNAGHGFNIYALAEGDAAPTAYTKSGKLFDHRDSKSDLFMKVQVVEQFMNVFNDHESNQMKWYDSRTEADNFASKNRIGILKKTTPKGTKEHSLQLIPL